MSWFNCCYPKKCKTKKNIHDEIDDVVIDSKQRYYYYYTCIPFHEGINRLSMLFKCKKTQNMIPIYMNKIYLKKYFLYTIV